MIYAFDCETYPITPGLTTPRVVCLTYYSPDSGEVILDREDAVRWFYDAIQTDALIAANVSFDLRVMARACQEEGFDDVLEHVFVALNEGRVRCTHIRERLITLGLRGYVPEVDLARLVQKYFDVTLTGKSGYDAWRLRYNELADKPVDQWPSSAIRYALDDAIWAYKVYFRAAEANHVKVTSQPSGLLAVYDECQQVAADFCLGLMTQWGIRVDGPRVGRLADKWTAEREKLVPFLTSSGVLRADRTANRSVIQQLVYLAYGGNPPMSPPSKTFPAGQVKTDKDTIENAPNPDKRLLTLIEYNALTKNISTYAKPCLDASRQGVPITPRYSVLMKTGRTSSSKPNIQNQNQNSGIRECFIPRDGCVFVFADWNGQEDRSLAQVMEFLGMQSESAKRYREDPFFDPHSDVGWRLLREKHGADLGYSLFKDIVQTKGIESKMRALGLEDADLGDLDPEDLGRVYKRVKWARSMAKIVVFGAPGGMVASTLAEYAAGWGLILSADFCALLLRLWAESDPARQAYLRDRKLQTRYGQNADWQHPTSGRVRAACRYTEFCNTPFQGQTADGAKYSLFLFSWSCYAQNGPYSDLCYGARPMAFIHDEIGAECHEEQCQDVAKGLQACMDRGMNAFHPDVPCVCEVDIMRRWSKAAASETLEDGTLTIWQEETP